MKLTIPAINARIKLSKDWSFKLCCSSNYDMKKFYPAESFIEKAEVELTIFKDTILSITNLQVTKAYPERDSVYFKFIDNIPKVITPNLIWRTKKNSNSIKATFCVALEVANGIEFEYVM